MSKHVHTLEWFEKERNQLEDYDPATGWPKNAQNVEEMYGAMQESGVVKANFTDLSLTGFTADVTQYFDIANATTPEMDENCTYPKSSYSKDFGAIFDENRVLDNPVGIEGKLVINPVHGQPNTWRINGTYSGKAQAANVGVEISLTNANSGYVASRNVTLPSGITSGTFMIELTVISDAGNNGDDFGYFMGVRTSLDDASLTLDISDLTRINPVANVAR